MENRENILLQFEQDGNVKGSIRFKIINNTLASINFADWDEDTAAHNLNNMRKFYLCYEN